MSKLEARNLSVTMGGASLLRDAEFTLTPGELVAIVGPNGAGKSTLLKCLTGLVSPQSGEVVLDGQALASLASGERARKLAYLPQDRPLAWPIRVRDAVALGRFAYGASSALTGADADAVSMAMTDCGIAHMAARRTDTLSGGELARVHLARTFASAAPLVLADEPVASLDPRHQFITMALLQAFVMKGGGAAVVLHDIPLAARFATRLVWLQDGKVTANGSPEDTVTPERLYEVFGIEASVTPSPDGPIIRFVGVPVG